MLGRPILKKQTGYSFYRPGATVISNTVADIPFSAVRVLIYDIIVYFMSGLARNPGGFFTFHLFVGCSLSSSGFLYSDIFAGLPGVFDSARLLPHVRSHVQQLRFRLPSRGLLRPQHDCLHWLHDSCLPNEAMVVLDRTFYLYCRMGSADETTVLHQSSFLCLLRSPRE